MNMKKCCINFGYYSNTQDVRNVPPIPTNNNYSYNHCFSKITSINQPSIVSAILTRNKSFHVFYPAKNRNNNEVEFGSCCFLNLIS